MAPDVSRAVDALREWWETEGWNIGNVDHPLPYEEIVTVVLKAAFNDGQVSDADA